MAKLTNCWLLVLPLPYISCLHETKLEICLRRKLILFFLRFLRKLSYKSCPFCGVKMPKDDFKTLHRVKTTIRRKLNEKKNNFLFIYFQHELLKIKFCSSCAFENGEWFSFSHNYFKRFETKPSVNSKLLCSLIRCHYHPYFNLNTLQYTFPHTHPSNQFPYFGLPIPFIICTKQNQTELQEKKLFALIPPAGLEGFASTSPQTYISSIYNIIIFGWNKNERQIKNRYKAGKNEDGNSQDDHFPNKYCREQ